MGVTLKDKERDYLRLYNEYNKIAPTGKFIEWMEEVNEEEEYVLVDFIRHISKDFWVVHKINPPF